MLPIMTEDSINILYKKLEQINGEIYEQIQNCFSFSRDRAIAREVRSHLKNQEAEEKYRNSRRGVSDRESELPVRFFKPHYDESKRLCEIGRVPDFLKLDIEKYKRDVEIYNKLSNEEKYQLGLNMRKGLAVGNAILANIMNRQKYSSMIDKGTMMKKKHMYIAGFIANAMIYNRLAKGREDTFEMGIREDEHDKYVLDASIPEFSKLSVHMGGCIDNTRKILEDVERYVSGVSFDRKNFRDGRTVIDVDEVARRSEFCYSVPDYAIEHIGIINRCYAEEAQVYIDCMKGLRENGNLSFELGYFLNEVCPTIISPELNSRELYFLAEKAGYMKKGFKEVAEAITQREETRSGGSYIERKMRECGGDAEKQKELVSQIFDTHFSNPIRALREKTLGATGDIVEEYNKLRSSLKNFGIVSEEIIDLVAEEKILNQIIQDGQFNEVYTDYASNGGWIINEELLESVCDNCGLETRFRYFSNLALERVLNANPDKEDGENGFGPENEEEVLQILGVTENRAENNVNTNLKMYLLLNKLYENKIRMQDFKEEIVKIFNNSGEKCENMELLKDFIRECIENANKKPDSGIDVFANQIIEELHSGVYEELKDITRETDVRDRAGIRMPDEKQEEKNESNIE